MEAAEKLITENLDVWTSAIAIKSSAGRGSSKKREPHGIEKLRELILELAVRGLLVPQDADDEGAVSALQACGVKLKKWAVANEEQRHNTPRSWSWIRFAGVGEQRLGKMLDKAKNKGNSKPYLRNTNVQWMRFELDDLKEMRVEEREEEELRLKHGDLLVCEGGEPGRCAIWRDETPEMYFQKALHRVRPCEAILSDYLALNLRVDCRNGALGALFTGATIKHLTGRSLAAYPIPIPPLAEQHRIVAKVDELMALCDQLEQEQESSLDTHDTLVATLLGALTTATADASQFAEAWQRIQANFDTLFTTESSIDQLKQTILQLAVMGKLGPQDPNDEPASELLKKIATEKAQLIKEKKIKKQKPPPPVSDDEKPFKIPETWEWARLQTITKKITDGDHKTPPRITSGKRLFSAKNVRDGFIDYDNCDFISEIDFTKSRERCLPEEGDLLMVSVGGTIGRSSLVLKDSDFALVRSVALIKPLGFESKFLKYTADAPILQDSIHSNKRGGAQPCLYLSEISKFPFPLPPLAEQHRIVTKVDELMALCDQLKASLTTAQATQLNLADSLVEQAIA